MSTSTGPLSGLRIIELAGIGPGPFCGMMLADAGAEVIRIDRPGGNPAAGFGHDTMFRNRKSIAVDLKKPGGIKTILKLCETADGLFEGYRPGVTEKLGIGPEQCMAQNPALVYGRMTGWGQTGPMAQAAGHDLNYISLSGAAAAIGRAGQKPTPPLNLVGDFGGGGMMLAFGMVSAMLSAKSTGKGQVVDTSMVEGSAALMSMFFDMHNVGMHSLTPGTNLLDGGAPFYDVYETADGKYVSIGSIEPQFYALLRQHADLSDPIFDNQMDFTQWRDQKTALETVFKQKTRDQWCEIMEGTDSCFAPVLDLTEAPNHPHNVARGSFVEVNGQMQPGPVPKFSSAGNAKPTPAAKPGTDTAETLLACGIPQAEIDSLLADGAVVQL